MRLCAGPMITVCNPLKTNPSAKLGNQPPLPVSVPCGGHSVHAPANDALYINLSVNRFGQLYWLGKRQQESLPKLHRPLKCGLEKITLLETRVSVCARARVHHVQRVCITTKLWEHEPCVLNNASVSSTGPVGKTGAAPRAESLAGGRQLGKPLSMPHVPSPPRTCQVCSRCGERKGLALSTCHTSRK